jgi:hypothetical protein
MQILEGAANHMLHLLICFSIHSISTNLDSATKSLAQHKWCYQHLKYFASLIFLLLVLIIVSPSVRDALPPTYWCFRKFSVSTLMVVSVSMSASIILHPGKSANYPYVQSSAPSVQFSLVPLKICSTFQY